MRSRTLRTARKAAVAAVGGSVVITGVILIPLPGPGSLVILAGLAILATEFPAARRALRRLKEQARKITGRAESEESQTPQ
ncbi:MAG: PGPGW domain-containing protein [Acidimicrobiia bacterium]